MPPQGFASLDDRRREFRVRSRILVLEDYGRGTILVDDGLAPRGPRFLRPVSDMIVALALLARATPRSCILVPGTFRPSLFACLLNRFLYRYRRKIVLNDVFFETTSPLARFLYRHIVAGATLTVVWSRSQVDLLAAHLGVNREKLFFMPFKSNHSRIAPLRVPIDGYVFSGGNSLRDYRTLFRAVEGTGIPVVVCATDRRVLEGLEIPSNVILVAAEEPHFARLMAGSRLVAIALRSGMVRGGGEGTYCDAMWQGKPVVAADDVSAADYILHGETGYVVRAGDHQNLRARILELWEDEPRCRAMGARAHRHVENSLTHAHFVSRILDLAERTSENSPPVAGNAAFSL